MLKPWWSQEDFVAEPDNSYQQAHSESPTNWGRLAHASPELTRGKSEGRNVRSGRRADASGIGQAEGYRRSAASAAVDVKRAAMRLRKRFGER